MVLDVNQRIKCCLPTLVILTVLVFDGRLTKALAFNPATSGSLSFYEPQMRPKGSGLYRPQADRVEQSLGQVGTKSTPINNTLAKVKARKKIALPPRRR